MPAETAQKARFFYRAEYVGDCVEQGPRHSFDVERPRKICEALIASGALARGDFVASPPLGDDDLALVHARSYIDAIRCSDTLARYLLLDATRCWGDNLLDPFLYAAGGTVAAARSAAFSGHLAVNLAGGYHHAQYDKTEGFCAIADVAVAIRKLREEGFCDRVLLVDLDAHHGNGNALIFAEDESVFTFSIHDVRWCQVEKRNHRDVELPPHTGDAGYLASLPLHLPEIVSTFAPGLAIYLAGSDPFIEDPLGVFDLTEPGLLKRDQLVTRETFGHGVPLAVVAAGGYGTSSWRIYSNYFHWLLDETAALWR